MDRVSSLSKPEADRPPAPAKLLDQAAWERTDVAAEAYDSMGWTLREHVIGALPKGWSFEGKRVLDFGCGAGRVLRHLLREAESAEVWGCDRDEPSIRWLDENLCPPLNVFANSERPPLPQPSASFDLIVAVSVFTHLVEDWSEWLLDLHRLLRDDGLLVATFTNRGLSFPLDAENWHEAWDEDQIGMHVYNSGMSWDEGGPAVYHSLWWLQAHWGRAFEFIHLQPAGLGFVEGSSYGQGIAVMRKKPIALTPEDLEVPEAEEPREIAALFYTLRHSRRETAARVGEIRRLTAGLAAIREKSTARTRPSRGRRHKLRRRKKKLRRVRGKLRAHRRSLSWRCTAPLRALVDMARPRRGTTD